jgi:hypothetical protein
MGGAASGSAGDRTLCFVGFVPLLHDPSRSTLERLLSLWAIVLGGNLIGAFVFAAIAL